MRTQRLSISGLTVYVLFALSGLVAAHSALAQSHSSRSSVGYRGGSNHLSSRSVTRPQQPSRLLPPAGLGSAANAPPGFYRRNLSVPEPQFHHPAPGHHAVPVYIPYPVYVTPPELALSPSQVGAPPPQDALLSQPVPQESFRPSSAPPQPIYIIQPPAAAAPEPPPVPAYPAPQASSPPPPPAPVSTEPAPIRFTIRPPDAEVYLDDEFLGTGADLTGRTQPLMLRPGVYVLEVLHADLRGQRLVFGFRSGEATDVQVDLHADRPRQRSRIR